MAFFRKPTATAAARPTPTPLPAPRPVAEPQEHLTVEASSLREAELSPDGRLLFPSQSAPAIGCRVAILIVGVDQAAFAITGTVQAARGAGSGRRLAAAIDEDQRVLLRRILAHVQDGAERPRARAPRLRISMPAVVTTSAGTVYMNTFSVSRGGCGLRWSGTAPRIGSVVHLRLGAGFSAPILRAMVCWVEEQRSGLRVGFRFVNGQDGRLDALLDTAGGAANGVAAPP